MRNTTQHFSFIVLSVATLTFSTCKKNDSQVSIDYSAFQQCEESQQWDSTKIATHLIGSWKLYAMSCFWTSNKDADTMDVQVNFDSSGNFMVLEHSILHSQVPGK